MDTPATIVFVVLALLAGLIVLSLAFLLFMKALLGAGVILAYASEQGFIGVAVYVACWVFLFPVMLIASIVVGFLADAP